MSHLWFFNNLISKIVLRIRTIYGWYKISVMLLLVGLPYFEKQKSGRWMTNFHETKFMAPPTFFFIKSGTVRCGCRLDCRGKGADLQTKTKIGVFSIKKKKKGQRLLIPRFVTFSNPKVDKFCNRKGVDLFFFCFFFLEITPIFLFVFRSAPLPRQSNLQPHLTVPLLLEN